ncbi:MAG: tRNA (guanosine(37)-N1)-methyltransferase TrmD [Planctomycetota bacterium]
MRIDVLTIFPDMFAGVCAEGILRIAREKGHLDLRVHDLRDWTHDSHRSVDDRPFGGGPGMVMKPEPVFEAVESLEEEPPRPLRILLCPQGETLSQTIAGDLARAERLLLIAGHYEGFDERIRMGLAPREISIGDYVLSGGELPAMVVLDAVARLIPGVVGDEQSVECESFQDGLLDFPQYTRPRVFRDMTVPDVLLSGNHDAIRSWRHAQRIERTRLRRGDLLASLRKDDSSGPDQTR